jgi:hypothetical protein
MKLTHRIRLYGYAIFGIALPLAIDAIKTWRRGQ